MKNVSFIYLLIFATFALSADTISATDPTPRALLFAGFNNGRVSGDAKLHIQQVTYDPNGKIGEGIFVRKDKTGSWISSDIERIDTRRGSVAFWIKLNNSSTIGLPQLFNIYPGPPYIEANFLPDRPDPKNSAVTLPGEITFTMRLVPTVDGNYSIEEKVGTGGFSFRPGEWHHVVWTWQGMNHKVYLDGTLKHKKVFSSPMPPQALPTFRIGPSFDGFEDVTIDELGTYNFALTPSEVTAAYSATISKPVAPINPHGIDVTAEWGPGVGKVSIAADSGNDFEGSAVKYIVNVYRDGKLIKSGEITKLLRGFGETLISIGTMTPGSYFATVKLVNSRSMVLAIKNSSSFVVPKSAWLGNSLGVSSRVQPPWTAIVVNGLKLSVWGREYDLRGGFGLPRQITSQGQQLLASPVALEIDLRSGPIQLKPSSLSITSIQPHLVTWQGTAAGQGITASVSGSLEYDGMMLITLKLSPTTGPITIKTVRLQTVLPSRRALFMHTTTDQPYWWYPYKSAVPSVPGVFHTNLAQKPRKSTFLAVVLFSDDDRGLEWLGENPAGWRVNEALPIQEMIRDGNGNVRLQNNFVNKNFNLGDPIEINFGYDATPVKPLPADWRGGRFGAAGGTSVFPNNDFDVYWDWRGQSTGGRSNANFPIFSLVPRDSNLYKTATQGMRHEGRKVAPFTNFHVTIPSGGHTWIDLDPIKAETANDGWISVPTKGDADYWVYNVNNALSNNTYDGLYIDEPEPYTSASLLSGGYIKEDGTHGAGYMLLGMREKLKRIRQVMLDNGKRPVIWLHTTAKMYPHAFAFADIASDGESFMFEKPTDPDWIDVWGKNKSEWLRGLSRSQKFGLTHVFLNYIKFYSLPAEYTKALRAMYGVLTIHDILPIDPEPWFAMIKKDFGITASDVNFKGFWEQAAVHPDNLNVKVSYYTRAKAALIFLTNMGEDYVGTVRVDISRLGLDPARTVASDAESKQSIDTSGGKISMSIPRHDFKVLRLDTIGAKN